MGDCLFLAIVGVTAAWVHDLIGSFPLAVLAGMAAGMAIQTVLAWAVSPLLGSIESRVSSMVVVAMTTPMLLCGLFALGAHLGVWTSLPVGAAAGVSWFAVIRAYGLRCRKATC